MITAQQCLVRYGNPVLASTQSKHFVLWLVDEDIQKAFSHVRFSAAGTIGFPKKIFVNKDFQAILEQALRNVIKEGLSQELKTWDGCFIIRNKVVGSSMSLHSWAVAIDLNREDNDYGKTPHLSSRFVKCFTDAGCDWGGNWRVKDGMHFQLAKLP